MMLSRNSLNYDSNIQNYKCSFGNSCANIYCLIKILLNIQKVTKKLLKQKEALKLKIFSKTQQKKKITNLWKLCQKRGNHLHLLQIWVINAFLILIFWDHQLLKKEIKKKLNKKLNREAIKIMDQVDQWEKFINLKMILEEALWAIQNILLVKQNFKIYWLKVILKRSFFW